MIFRTHIAFALLIGILSHNYSLDDNWILFFTFLFIGSSFPDIDHGKSKVGRNFFSKIITVFSGHRRIFHSLFFGIVLAYLFFLYAEDAGLGFFLGFLSHIILDSLTDKGVNFLYPFGKFVFKGFIKTGGMLETILFYFLAVLDAVMLLILTQSF